MSSNAMGLIGILVPVAAVSNAVIHIVGGRTPAQVIRSVVLGVVVPVQNIRHLGMLGVSIEGGTHKSMHVLGSGLSVTGQGYLIIPTTGVWFKHSPISASLS